VPELCALLNSLEYVGNRHDVHVIGHNLPQELVSQFGGLGYQVIHHKFSDEECKEAGGPSEILCRKRYALAGDVGVRYQATCILDADMFFCRSVDAYLQIASNTDLILGAALEQKRVYGHIEHQKIRGEDDEMVPILPEPVWNDKDICCAPIFLDMSKYHDIFRESWLLFSEQGFKAPDMEAYNILLIRDGLTKNVLMLSNVQFVGTNEKLLKPYMRAIHKGEDNNIWTETGDPIFIVHGQFYKGKWRRQQILNRKGCIDGYLGGSEKAENMAQGAMDMLYQRFKEMLDYKMTVEKKAYVPDGDMEWKPKEPQESASP
jgi:hypothetical protein